MLCVGLDEDALRARSTPSWGTRACSSWCAALSLCVRRPAGVRCRATSAAHGAGGAGRRIGRGAARVPRAGAGRRASDRAAGPPARAASSSATTSTSTGDRLGLIEINTNAGGAMLNAVLARAQRACCAAIDPWCRAWQAPAPSSSASSTCSAASGGCRRTRPLRQHRHRREAPQDQYLYPEFLLFQQLFERHGLQAVIADPACSWRDGSSGTTTPAIDLVYNRLTDFDLEHRPAPHCARLLQRRVC